ncbi:MAG: pyruvate kinase [Candidatus Uhrbacteria bacterium]|nr:pyruvate kinase [Candidatus Uhrbacteria bacterium]
MKRTKIVCTIGPASDKESTLTSMMKAGMDVARLNFSHGTHAGHAKLLRLVRKTAKKLNKPIAVIGDLQGPKIRLGVLPDAGVSVPTGSMVVLSTASTTYKAGFIPVTYTNLHKDVKVGNRILIDDGLLEGEVTQVSGKNIHMKMKNGGTVTSHKGMNFPDSTLKVSSLTEKDRDDVKFGVLQEVDWMALSFVTSAADVRLLRKLIKAAAKPGQVLPRIIVKIEKHEAIENFDEIMKATDAVMVARGDLGVEIPAEEVPVRQKEMIEKCRNAGKPVVVATQMLDSMIRNPRPTRAEVSDVANAVFDHADGVMLSGESASGKYPLAAVKMMAQIVVEAEGSKFDDVPLSVEPPADQPASVAHAIKLLAMQGSIDGVLVSQELAPWSETVLRSHPEIPLFLAVPNKQLEQQTVLRWSAMPFVLKHANEKTFLKRALLELKKKKWTKKGMKLAVIMGGSHGEGFDHVVV